MATILWHKNKLTGGMCLLGFRQPAPSVPCHFYLPLGYFSSSSEAKLTYWFLPSTLSLISMSWRHNIIQSTCATLEVLDINMILWVQDTMWQKDGWNGCGSIDNIYGLVAAISSLINKTNHLPHPFWQGQYVVVNLRDNIRGCLTPNTKVTLIEQSSNTHCIAACYN